MIYRNRKLLDLARGRPCMLQIQGVCCDDPETTVACHSNQLEDGKGKSLKASDAATCWGCFTCHTWLDQGPAPRVEKVEAFNRAVKRTYRYLMENELLVIA